MIARIALRLDESYKLLKNNTVLALVTSLENLTDISGMHVFPPRIQYFVPQPGDGERQK